MTINNVKIPTSVGIIDIGISNIASIERTLSEIVDEVVIVRNGSQLTSIDRLILPGVGAFPSAMKRLSESGLVADIHEFVRVLRRPLLGICLGMQLLASEGEEHELTAGLDLVKGRVRRLKESDGVRVPHVGWNSVSIEMPNNLFNGLVDGHDFYFVHSYVFDVDNKDERIATTVNGERFTAAVLSGNVVGVQFHPEKSSKIGRMLLENFCEWTPC